MTSHWQHVDALRRQIAEAELRRYELVITATPRHVMVEVAGAYALKPRVYERGTRGYEMFAWLAKREANDV